MAIIDPPRRRVHVAGSAIVLAATLTGALGLGFAPRAATEPLRNAWREAIRPPLAILTSTSQWCAQRWTSWRQGANARLSETQQQLEEMTARLEHTEMQLQIARSNRAGVSADETNPLLIAQLTHARVLGRQAKSLLNAQDILDLGSSRGAAAEALVIDDATTAVDQGRDAAIEPGRLVLAGSRVWGKVTHVGPHTSTVRRATEAGYRDLVQLATPREGRLHFSARGVLVGRGETLCKIELVEATEPVSVGDLVFTADDGVLDVPLLYGRIERLERKPGAAHWEIWMAPAIDPAWPPARVGVLRLDLNPARVASSR